MFDLSTLLNSAWGPTEDAIPTTDASLPFVPYAKGDSICYIVDWNPNHKQHKTRHGQFKFLGAQNIIQLGVFSDEDSESYTSECSNHDRDNDDGNVCIMCIISILLFDDKQEHQDNLKPSRQRKDRN